jgi:phage-related tail protein
VPTGQTGAQGFDPDQVAEKAATTALQRLKQEQKAEDDAKRQTDQEAYYSQAKTVRQEIRNDLLKKLEIKTDDYRAPIIGALAESMINAAISKSLKVHPKYAGATDEVIAAVAGRELATKEEREAAIASAVKMWQDLGNEFVSSGVKGQTGLPGSTLGDGAGGPMPAATREDFQKWPKAQQDHWIATGKRFG